MIYVCPLSQLELVVETHRCSHLVTLINDETLVDTPKSVRPDNHLRLRMNDIAEEREGMVAPNERHVAELIDFAQGWDQSAPMAIHCWAGISRSTAAAFVTLCALNPDIDEHHIARHLRALSPTATPNPRIVMLADRLLERGGRMRAAIDAIGYGHMAQEGVPFSLQVTFSPQAGPRRGNHSG